MPFDQYNGHLDNSGEELVLLSAERDTLCSFAYDDENGWPESPDGEGRSLVPVEMDPTGNQRLPSSGEPHGISEGLPEQMIFTDRNDLPPK